MNLIADSDIPYIKGIFEPYFDTVSYKKGCDIQNSDVLHTDILIVRTRTKCNESLLKNSRVRVVATATIGTDHIDLDYCKSVGIKVFSAPGCNSAAVQQYVLAGILEYLKLLPSKKAVTLGVVGVGNIGRLVCNIGKALGMNVLKNDPPRERAEGGSSFVNIDTIAKESDIVTFHVPFSRYGIDSTYNLADELFFQKLKANALIINTSRGGIVNEEVLLKASNTEGINYILDVWENEPKMNFDLLNNAMIATPHIAGYSLEGKINATKMVVDSIFDYLGLSKKWEPEENLAKQKIHINLLKFIENKELNLNKLIKEVYNIRSDDETLRQNPANFEMLRNSYCYRRENSAYTIIGKDKHNKEILDLLGFQTGDEII